MVRDTQENFQTAKGFKSYVSKPEITDLAPNFLVRGSKNVLIDYAQRIISRNGYTLFGVAGTMGGIKSSVEWASSTGKYFPLRAHDNQLEFYWNSTWNTLVTGLSSPYLEFAKVWDNTEKIDVLLYVLGEANTYKWSGGVAKVRSSTAATLTKQGVLTSVVTIAFVANVPNTTAGQITDSAANFLNAGFAAGDTITVIGSTGNSRNFTIGSVTAGTITVIMSDTIVSEAVGSSITLHNGEPTWATSRFLTTTTRYIVYNGVSYTYTGGESTDTLTGLTAFPTVAVGDVVWQQVATLANSGDINTNFRQDLIGVQLNQVILGSTKSQEIYVSSGSNYTSFGLTSPRVPGDPAKLVMDNFCTCIISVDNSDGTPSALMFGGGTSDFFRMSYYLSQDNANELVRMIKLKTAIGAGLVSKDAIGSIKNATAYISREPSLETLGAIQNIDGRQNVPISDDIKDDFDAYNFLGAHIKYWKRAIYIALPAEGLVLIYDLQRQLWQPPQTIPISRFAIIGDWLYGHSNLTNETYKLFVGTDDNGIFIPQVARFAYNNGGNRTRLKNLTEYWTDGYISANGTLQYTINFGFAGALGSSTCTILGNDSDIVGTGSADPLGQDPLGQDPFGGGTLDPVLGLPGTNLPLQRFFQIDTNTMVDHMESYVEYVMNTLGGQFAIVAHGNNQFDAGTAPVTHKK